MAEQRHHPSHGMRSRADAEAAEVAEQERRDAEADAARQQHAAMIEEPAPLPPPEEPAPIVRPTDAQTLPSAHLMPGPAAPTLTHAFTVLCAALQGHLGDNQVQAAHCDEIQAWMSNAGGDIHADNSIMAWRHAVAILAEVLGKPMTL